MLAVAYFNEKFYTFTNDGCMCLFEGNYWKEDYPDGSSLPMIRHRQTAVIVDNLKNFILEELAIECNVGTWNDYNDMKAAVLELLGE